VSNADSGSNPDLEVLAVGAGFGTSFTVNLRNIELSGEDRQSISNAIINLIIAHIEVDAEEQSDDSADAGTGTPSLSDIIEALEGLYTKYGRY
jgi:hypothetical protein